MTTVKLEIKNCLDCPHHEQQRDPDPDDWFNDDDMKAVCKKANGRVVASGERPYHLKAACEIPTWCPLQTDTKKSKPTKKGRAK